MNDMIKQIISKNKEDLKRKKEQISLASLKKSAGVSVKTRDFYHTIQTGYEKNGVGLIAEIKLASPTEAHLGEALDISQRAQEYEVAGADAISIVTEKYFFHGESAFVKQIQDTVDVPVLQKDFIVDAYQIYEARESGADALLLIVKLLDTKTLQEFVDICNSLSMEPVVEINDEKDLGKALQANTRIIAVNARDLDTFTIDVVRACKLLKKISDTFLKLGFSGIQTAEQVAQYKKAGAKGVLVGTSLMKAIDIESYIKELRSI